MTNPKDETQRTHWEGCWKTYGHHDCAVERVAELEAALDRQRQSRIRDCFHLAEKLNNAEMALAREEQRKKETK